MKPLQSVILGCILAVVPLGSLWTCFKLPRMRPVLWILIIGHVLYCATSCVALAFGRYASLQRWVDPLVQCGSVILAPTEVSPTPSYTSVVYTQHHTIRWLN